MIIDDDFNTRGNLSDYSMSEPKVNFTNLEF